MREFFKVTDIEALLSLAQQFETVGCETIPLDQAPGRVLAADLRAAHDLPGFDRSTMDGYALAASSTFGASESNPAYIEVVGSVTMGETPDLKIGPGQAARIATGGMLPAGSDSVVMIEHTEAIDAETLEVYRSVAPGQNVVARDEDAAAGQLLIAAGTRLRPQELGVLAALGHGTVEVYAQPRVGILSTGDEVVPIDARPAPGQVRDVNGTTLAALVRLDGGIPRHFGIVGDDYEALLTACRRALADSDMVLVSGGSSVGTRDLTIDVLSALPQSRILVHGVSIRPGKPTILAQCGARAFWGLPGHVTSAMVVYMILVRPFLARVGGGRPAAPRSLTARLSRNLPSVQGRVDYVRVRLIEQDGQRWAEPVLGGSGLIRTMVAADGLVAIDLNSEGLDQGTEVEVLLI